MRPLTLFLSIIAGLVAGCTVDNSAPAAEADAFDAGQEDSDFGQGKVWRVGPEREYKTPSAVADRVGNGDVVLIDAATYKCDTGVAWYADHLTLKGVGGRPHLDAEKCFIPDGKAIWTPVGTGLLVDNIEFSGASVYDENGAGIRFQGDGEVIIRNSFFHHNENGILFTPPSGDSTDLLIEHTEFAYNGTDDGQAHNVYVNAGRSLTFRYNYSHNSNVGHLLKTRAFSNYILYNRLMTMDGSGSYEIDIADGGDNWIVGNIIQQGALSENQSIVAFGAETSEESPTEHRLFMINNTVINDRTEGVTLVRQPDYSLDELRLVNNLLVGIPESELDALEDFGGTLDHNLATDAPGFQDRQHFNYALTAGSPAIDAGIDPGIDHLGATLAPDRVYRHLMAFEPRKLAGANPDLGAIEQNGEPIVAPTVALQAQTTIVDYGDDAKIDWSATAADRCLATGDWGGSMAPDGKASVGPLHQVAHFALSCEGPGGVASAALQVDVTEHPLAATYPDYRFVELADTQILPLCHDEFPYSGVGDCTARELSAAYVPVEDAYYLFGGGDRSYFGNEVIRLDLKQGDLSIAAGATDPRDTSNYNANHEGSWDMIDPCSGVWDLQDGGVVPAPSRVYSSWIYAPTAGKIFKNSGRVACGSSWYDTDSWWFDPDGHDWQLLSREGLIPSPGSHAVHDPDSGQILLIGESAIYRFDPKSEDLVELGPHADLVWSTTAVLDPVNDVILIIGNGPYQYSKFTVIDVRGVDANATSLPDQETWTASGDLSLLDIDSPALAYDEDRNAVVGWDGGDKLFFLAVDREARRIEFIARKLDKAPTFEGPARNTFLYAKEQKAFVVYTGVDSNFHLLKAND